jgi:uncharacterized membrane protein
MPDRFTIAVSIAAFLSAIVCVAVAYALTEGEWYFRVIAGLACWAASWLAMGFSSEWAE